MALNIRTYKGGSISLKNTSRFKALPFDVVVYTFRDDGWHIIDNERLLDVKNLCMYHLSPQLMDRYIKGLNIRIYPIKLPHEAVIKLLEELT